MDKKLILHAGSLYKDYLILYGENQTPRIIQVKNAHLQWDIYYNDIELDHETEHSATLNFQGNQYLFPCWKSDSPMKFLGFCQ